MIGTNEEFLTTKYKKTRNRITVCLIVCFFVLIVFIVVYFVFYQKNENQGSVLIVKKANIINVNSKDDSEEINSGIWYKFFGEIMTLFLNSKTLKEFETKISEDKKKHQELYNEIENLDLKGEEKIYKEYNKLKSENRINFVKHCNENDKDIIINSFFTLLISNKEKNSFSTLAFFIWGESSEELIFKLKSFLILKLIESFRDFFFENGYRRNDEKAVSWIIGSIFYSGVRVLPMISRGVSEEEVEKVFLLGKTDNLITSLFVGGIEGEVFFKILKQQLFKHFGLNKIINKSVPYNKQNLKPADGRFALNLFSFLFNLEIVFYRGFENDEFKTWLQTEEKLCIDLPFNCLYQKNTNDCKLKIIKKNVNTRKISILCFNNCYFIPIFRVDKII